MQLLPGDIRVLACFAAGLTSVNFEGCPELWGNASSKRTRSSLVPE